MGYPFRRFGYFNSQKNGIDVINMINFLLSGLWGIGMKDLEQGTADSLKCFCPVCHLVFGNPSREACPECGAAMPEDGWGLLPYPFRNNFILMDQLGRGGMGAVYKAISNETGLAVALKIARVDRDVEEMKHRFSREMAVANMLSERDQDAFVNVTSTDTMAQPYYMAMEFVDAPTLSAFIIKNGRSVKGRYVLPYMEAINLVDAILSSLSVAHHHKIVHMDIKPDNIFIEEMVSSDGKVFYHAKIADLGACIFEDDESSKDNMILGTPGYMSPEQIMGEDVNRSTDVFAVAAMMYELITGATPYEPEKGLRGKAMAKAYLDNMKAGRLQPSDIIPPDVFSLLKKAMAYKAPDRFATAEEFRAALKELLSSQVERNKSQLQFIHEQREALAERISSVRESLKDLLIVSTALLTIEQKLEKIPMKDQDIAMEPHVVKARLSRLASEARNLEARMAAVRRNLAIRNRGPVSRLGRKMVARLKKLLTRDEDGSSHGAPVLARGLAEGSVSMSQITSEAPKAGKKTSEVTKLAVKTPVKVMPPGSGRVLCVAFSPVGELLATGSNKGLIAMFDLRHGPKFFQGHEDSIRSIGFDPSGSLMITAGWDKSIKVWDVKTKQEVETMFGHTSGLWSAWFTADGKYIVSSASDDSLRVWTFPGGRIVKQARMTNKEVVSMVVSPDGDTAITGGGSGQIMKWSLPDLGKLGTVVGHEDAVRALGISPDGRVLATGGADGTVKTWDVGTMKEIATLKGHKGWIRSITVANEGQHLVATGSNDRSLRLWRANGEFLGVVGKTMPQIIPVSFSGNTMMLASGFEPDTVAIFSMEKFIRE